MASLTPDIIPRDLVVEKYGKQAMDIVFSLPELTRDEQATRLADDSVKSGSNEITLEVAERAIDMARRTF